MASNIITTNFFQLLVAFFAAFVLAHMTVRYFERFERFPSPLVTPGPSLPAVIQGRDFIPHNRKPTLPPGPPVPLAVESDSHLYETIPPGAPTTVPRVQLSAAIAAQQQLAQPVGTPATFPPLYRMTRDDYLNAVNPDVSIPMTTMTPERQGLTAMGPSLATLVG